MSFDYIRRTYGVPAKRGGRVEYTGHYAPQGGTIRSARNGYVMIQLDGRKFPTPFHPTWKLRYLEDSK